MTKRIDLWTEEDLNALVGQAESRRLEFKSGRLLEKQDREWVEDLSIAVSAFANSGGGMIVVGMSEKKMGKDRVADRLDGIDISAIGITRFQQMVEASVSPRVPGLRFRVVRFAERAEQHGCILIEVPEGSTAYQAKDARYYGRSEFENRALPDHDVRLRMQKGHLKSARLDVRRWRLGTHYKLPTHQAADEARGIPYGEAEHYERLCAAGEEVADITGMMAISTFGVGVTNTCDRTIRDLTVEINTHPDTRAWLYIGIERGDVSESLPKRYRLPDGERLHPGETLDFPSEAFTVVAGEHWEPSDTTPPVLWTIYVEDGSPTSGEIGFTDIGFSR